VNRVTATSSSSATDPLLPESYPTGRYPLTPAFAIGLVGAALAVAWPLFRSRTHMLLAQSGVALFFGLHYVLEGAITGAAMNALAFTQALLAIPLGGRPGFRLAYLGTLPLIAIALVMTWSGAASVFAGLGFALISLGRYQLSAIRFRAFLLVAVPCWMMHNATVGSAPGLIADTCTLFTSGWMLRLDLMAAAKPTASS
jgi:hypothetical protein